MKEVQDWIVSCTPMGGGYVKEETLDNTVKKYTFQELSVNKEYIVSVVGRSCKYEKGNQLIHQCIRSRQSTRNVTLESNSPYVSVTSFTATTITLKWPSNAASRDALEVKYRPKNTGAWTKIESLNSESQTINGLRPKTLYEFEMQSKCSGAKCNKNSKAKSIEQYTTLEPPTQLKLLEIYTQLIKVYWRYSNKTYSEPFDENVAITLYSDK